MRWVFALLFLMGIVLTSYAESEHKHIVSVGGSVTEWIVELDRGDSLVGVDTTSLQPKKIMQLPKVGYQRQLSAEGVASLKANLIIGTEEMGPETALKQIKSLGIKVALLSSQADLSSLKNNLIKLGRLLNREDEANLAFENYQNQLNSLKMAVSKARKTQPVPRVLLVINMHGSVLAAGKHTTADWLIEQAGGLNVVEFTSHKALSNEALAALNPDIIIVADRRGIVDQRIVANIIKEIPALAMTNAAKHNKVIGLDASLLVAGLGPRLPLEANELAKTFYHLAPDVALTQ